MLRYEIEDIIYQDKHGGIFHAKDKETGHDVCLHRFFPNGLNNEGLSTEQANAYLEACKFMAEISHPSLRIIHEAGVDTVDSTPYVVTEWVEGVSLHNLLADNSLHPEFVTELLRMLLEASIHVSELVGHEELWVDTDIASMVFSQENEERPLTFRLSPMKWLSTSRSVRKSVALSELVRKLMQWEDKKFSDHDGKGLGTWLSWLKQNPDTDLAPALRSLVVCARNAKAQFQTSSSPLKPQTQVLKKSKSDSRTLTKVFLLAIVPMTLACVTLYMVRNKKLEEKAPPVATKATQTTSPESATSQPKPITQQEDLTQRALAMRQEIEKAESEQEAELAKIKSSAQAQDNVFTPDDTPYASTLKVGTPFKVRGKLAKIGKSKSQASLYFLFSEPFKEGQLRGLVKKGDFQDTYADETFAHLIGKTIVIDGVIEKYPPPNPILVKILRLSQITVE